MEQTKRKIEIVEYHEGLAAGVAEMWNLSRDGWGGDSHVTTEQKVRIQEANSSNLNLYLAMDGDTVVGYCGLCEYREDGGALYIPLLNVRSDYHGKKIGKLLVLKALERTTELNWPRLDLYTWAGNTKAVPLYKKCGFFWEDRDDTTHLMNFMPTVLNTEAVMDYFSNVDWYEASTRVIEVTSDGRKANDFTYYEYMWDLNGNQLRMEFERTGRGLRTIETNEYAITVSVEGFTLVCDARYTVRYHIKNKSGKPLHIELKGENDKIVRYAFEQSLSVEDEAVVEATFQLGTLEEEQSNWRTHPSVVTNVRINGKKAKFAVGILPKWPAKITGVVPGSQCYVKEEAVYYLDVENNVNELTTYTLTIPKHELVSLKQSTFKVSLAPKEKTSISVPYTLINYGFYAPTIEVEANRENGIKQYFTKQISVGFKGLGARFYGECDDYWHIYNGLYHLYLRKFDNDLIPGRLTKGTQKTIGMFPKLGKPYSSEFSKRKPRLVEYKEENGAMVLYATFESSDFARVEVVSVSKLYGEGILEQSYIVRNENSEMTQPMWMHQPIYHELYKPVFVMNNHVVKVGDRASSEYGNWNSNDLTENWLFSRYEPYAHGITWPKDAKINFENWYMYVEHVLGNIQANGEVRTKPVYHSFGAYQSWEEFREFALRKRVRTAGTVDDLVLQTTGREAMLIDSKAGYFQGEVSFNKGKSTILAVEDKKREVREIIESDPSPLTSVIAEYEINGVRDCKKALSMNPSTQSISFQKSTRDGLEILEAGNGEISVAAAESFYPTVFSLKIKGKEWLDTTFPTLQPRAWWNPWSGGIRFVLDGINQKSFVSEKTIVGEGSLIDDEGRVWNGLKLSTIFTENEEFNGLSIQQYYVMLPGVPVIALFTKILQNTGTYMHYKKWYTEGAFALGTVKNAGSTRTYVAGSTEIQTELSNHVIVGSSTSEEMLQIIADREAINIEAYMNKEVMLVSTWRIIQMASGTELLSAPSFIIGSDNVLSVDEVEGLRRMTFIEVEKNENN